MKPSQDRIRTQASYDSLSRFYDRLSGPAEDRARRQAVDLLQIITGDLILEVGCGTGTSSIEMEKKAKPGGFIYGVDLSIQMLRVAQKKLQLEGQQKSIQLLNGDAVFLPIASRCVTGILMSFTLELFCDAEIAMVLSECKRVLRQEGRVCVLSMSKCQPHARLLKPYEWLHERFPAWIDCRPILLQETLIRNGFDILAARQHSLFGLPIEVVLASPKAIGTAR